MGIRLLAATFALVLGAGLAQGQEAMTPKARPHPAAAAATIDPLDVPRDMRDWFAKSVDNILTDEGPAANDKPAKTR